MEKGLIVNKWTVYLESSGPRLDSAVLTSGEDGLLVKPGGGESASRVSSLDEGLLGGLSNRPDVDVAVDTSAGQVDAVG